MSRFFGSALSFALSIALLVPAAPAYAAACTSPAAPEGSIEYFSTSGKIFQYCNGTSWKGFSAASGSDREIQFNSNGSLVGVPSFTYNTNGSVGHYLLNTSTTNEYWHLLQSYLDVRPSNNQAAGRVQRGFSSESAIDGSNTYQVRDVVGLHGNATNYGTGPVSDLVGTDGTAVNVGNAAVSNMTGIWSAATSSVGTISSMTSLNAYVELTGGTVTNIKGLSIEMNRTAGTMINRYGIYLTSPTGAATNDFGIYQQGTQKNYFAGNVGIGDVSPSVALDIVGDINYTGAIFDVSDARAKTDIRPLTDALSRLSALQGVSFRMKDDARRRVELGVIAQDVQKVYPELVETQPDGTLVMNYQGMVGPLVEAVKELDAEIDELEAENADLRQMVQDLSRRMDVVEATTP